jgi:rhodanese-related sulfurtransferase
LEYIPISPELLEGWAIRDEHLIVIDLSPKTHADADFEGIPGSLRIPPAQLRRYFWYLPPNTRLVLYDIFAVTRLDSRAENVLLMTGIQAVYVLEGGIGPRHACAARKRGAIELLSL